MKISQVRWLLIVVGVVISYWFITSEALTFGLAAEWVNGTYRISGGTYPRALSISAAILFCYILLLWADVSPVGKPIPGVLRRFLAFWFDFVAAMLCLGPLIGIIPTLSESVRTGVFAWTFERTVAAPGDTLLAVLCMALAVLGLLFYFSLPLVRQRPSPGACVMGYQVVPDVGSDLTLRKALLRSALGFIAVSVAYIAPFVARERKAGKFWLDRAFSTRAIALR